VSATPTQNTGPEPARAATARPATVHVAGLPVTPADVGDAVDLIWRDAHTDTPRVYVLVNGYSASLRRSSPAYAAALESPDCVPLADGAALTLGARLAGVGAIGRAPGPDVFTASCVRAASDGTRFFLLGGGEGVAETLRDELVREHPGLLVAGIATPPYGDWPTGASHALCDAVRASGAEILWLGVSAPKQETWALDHLAQLGIPTVCVGAAFDFLAGQKPRAPRWMQRLGLEWLFRLSSEPRRLWKRYLVGNTVFLADLVRFRGRPPREGS